MESPSPVSPDQLLSEDAFQNEQSQNLFKAIDELRNHGAQHDIELPELIIVGDQSAGKSSLLQSLTEIPFPVADGVCTRFPTRIVSKRTPFESEKIKISIEPSPTAIPDLNAFGQRYAEFSRVISSITAQEFKKIVNEATDLMGINQLDSSENGIQHHAVQGARKNFCDDILKVEISGPNRSYFSILDLPGIFQSLTKDLTESEKSLVRSMTMTHMSSSQSIIICVASGTNDMANQAVFDIASQRDPHGDRTVGVITKCDISQHVNQLMDLARNTEKHFRHGWFVVRNRTPSEAETSLEPIERHFREKTFFENAPWTELPIHRRGTQALKTFLAELLCTRIQEKFPAMLHELSDRIQLTRSRLESLGESRDATHKKRMYLTKLAQNFNQLASQALRGRYDSKTADNVKLRRMVREADDAFAKDMKVNGHTVAFVDLFQCQQNGELPSQNPLGFPGSDSKLNSEDPMDPASSSQIANGEFGNRSYTNNSTEIGNSKTQMSSSLFDGIPFQNRSSAMSSGASGAGSTPPTAPSAFGSAPSTTPSSAPVQRSGLFGSAPVQRSAVFGSATATNPTFNTSTSITGNTPVTMPSGFSASTSRAPSGPGEPGLLFPLQQSFFGKVPQNLSAGFSAGLEPATKQAPTSQTSINPSYGSGLFGAPPAAKSLASSNITSQTSSSLSPNKGLFRGGPITQGTGKSTLQTFEIYEWIRSEIKASKGTELQGILNPDVLPVLFHKQIEKWESISETHFQKVSEFTVSIMKKMLESICFDSLIRERLEKAIDHANEIVTGEGQQKLFARLQDLSARHLQTNNPAFEVKIRDARFSRFNAALERYALAHSQPVETEPENGESGSFLIKFDRKVTIKMTETASLFAELHMSNSRNLEDEIHDVLKAYYEIALNDFVEYVNQLVIEPYLNDPKGPVLLFSPLYIGGLTESEVDILAAESPSIVLERKDLEATLARLKIAEEIAQRYA